MLYKYFLCYVLLAISLPCHASSLALSSTLYSSIKFQNPIANSLSMVLFTYIMYNKLHNPFINKTIAQTEPIVDPNYTVFAFDLHDVLVIPNYKQGIQIAWNTPYKITLLKNAFNPVFILDFFKLFFTTTFEENIKTLAQKYPDFNDVAESIVDIANAQAPIWGMFDIIKELKEQGFNIYLFSNIGQEMFTRFVDDNPYLFKNFDGFFVTTAQDNYIHKPDPRAYSLFLDRFNLASGQVIFIDNLAMNIHAAQQAGIHGILFKTVPQLRSELVRINALKSAVTYLALILHGNVL